MKRKAVSILLGVGMAVTVCAGSAQAKTYGIDIGDGKMMQVTILDGEAKSTGETAIEAEDVQEAGTAGRAQETKEEYTITQDETGITICQEATAAYGDVTEGVYYKEAAERIEEYQEHGIGYDEKNGSFTWKGTPIFWLLDENGSIYQNGLEEAKEGKVYVLVTRNEDGSIKEAKKITAEEVVQERIRRDTLREELEAK